MKEVRYNPARPPDDPRDGPATYLHKALGVALRSDQWAPVDDATAEALLATGLPGIEVRSPAPATADEPEPVSEKPAAAASTRPRRSGEARG